MARPLALLSLALFAGLGGACRGEPGPSSDLDPAPSDPAPAPAPEAGAALSDAAPEVEGDPFAGIEGLRPAPWAAWPLEYVDLEQYAGWRIDPVSGDYERRDSLGFQADADAFVLAIADGRVTQVETPTKGHTFVVVDHGHGIESRLGPLREAAVHTHLPVRRGANLGLALGGPLELEVRVDGIAIDPLLALRQPLHRWPGQLRRLPAPTPP